SQTKEAHRKQKGIGYSCQSVPWRSVGSLLLVTMIEIQRVARVKHYSNSALDRLVNPGSRHFGSRRSKGKKEEIKIKNGAQGTPNIEGSEPDWHLRAASEFQLRVLTSQNLPVPQA